MSIGDIISAALNYEMAWNNYSKAGTVESVLVKAECHQELLDATRKLKSYADSMKWTWSVEDQVYYCGHGDCIWYGVCQEPDVKKEFGCKPAI